NLAEEALLGYFEFGFLDVVLRVGEIAAILFGGDFGLSDGLVQSGLSLVQRGSVLLQLKLAGAGIELNERIALFDGLAGRREPGDAKLRHERRVNLHGASGFQLAAASNNDEELAFARGSNGKVLRRLGLPELVDTRAGRAKCAEDDQGNQPAAQF